jgi:hypothetical protein
LILKPLTVRDPPSAVYRYCVTEAAAGLFPGAVGEEEDGGVDDEVELTSPVQPVNNPAAKPDTRIKMAKNVALGPIDK